MCQPWGTAIPPTCPGTQGNNPLLPRLRPPPGWSVSWGQLDMSQSSMFDSPASAHIFTTQPVIRTHRNFKIMQIKFGSYELKEEKTLFMCNDFSNIFSTYIIRTKCKAVVCCWWFSTSPLREFKYLKLDRLTANPQLFPCSVSNINWPTTWGSKHWFVNI